MLNTFFKRVTSKTTIATIKASKYCRQAGYINESQDLHKRGSRIKEKAMFDLASKRDLKTA